MEEKDKNQKTIVAFIAGLLIGGLLVWVFGIAPQDKKDDADDTKTDASAMEGSVDTASDDAEGDVKTLGNGDTKGSAASTVVARGAGSITVDDQPAVGLGGSVAIAKLAMPVENGWVVVHEVAAPGVLGNALGASRYSSSEGLKPTTVEVLRATEKGKTYYVVIYGENGDRVFDRKEDAPVTVDGGGRVEDSFVAQ